MRNCLRTICTIWPAARATALIASDENSQGSAPPIRKPMKTMGRHEMRMPLVSATGLHLHARHVGDERAEERHGCDHGRADGDTLGDGLGGVADCVQVGHDLARLGFEAGHLADAVGVVGDGAERVHGHVVAGQRQHADAGQGDAVQDEGGLLDRVSAPRREDEDRRQGSSAQSRQPPRRLASYPTPKPARMVVAGPPAVDAFDLLYRRACRCR